MARLTYPAGTGITTVVNTDLEADDMTFLGCSIAGAAQQTDYSDIKAGIVGNPGAIGGVTPATSLAVAGASTLTGATSLDGAVTINEAGANVDTRIEGDTDVNLFFVDADADAVGIGTNTPTAKFNVSGASTLDGATVMNESGADVDTRIEGDTATHLLFVDASVDAVGINTSSPASDVDLDVSGRVRQSAAVFYDEFWSGQAAEWATRITTGSTAAQSKDNGWIRMTTGAVLNDEESADWGDVCPFASTKRPTWECRIQLEQITNLEFYIGFIEASGGSDDDYLWFGFDAYSQNTWFCEASTAGATTTDMGAIADTNEVELRFIFTSDTAIEWFIDGVSQGVITSNIPTVQLQPVRRVITQEAAAHFVGIDFVKIWQDRT
jgi:hypothetical protein